VITFTYSVIITDIVVIVVAVIVVIAIDVVLLSLLLLLLFLSLLLLSQVTGLFFPALLLFNQQYSPPLRFQFSDYSNFLLRVTFQV